MNSRFRFHKYKAGQTFYRHSDSACAHEVGETGVIARSMCSVVIYLNNGYDGGATTFHLPDGRDLTVGETTGYGLIFSHQGSFRDWPHTGETVHSGEKYILRTDLMYVKAQ